MTSSNLKQPFWQKLIRPLRQALRALGKSSTDVFKPAEEELPDVGVQPYEGDPAEKTKGHHSWEG